MRKPRRIPVAISAFLLIPIFLTGSRIGPEDDKPPFPPLGFGGGAPDSRLVLILKERLELSDKQIEKIQQRILESETRVIRLMAELKIAEIQLAAKIRRPETSREQISGSIHSLGKIHYRIMRDFVYTFLDIRAMLTPDQRAKLAERMEKRKRSFSIPPP